MNTQEYIDSGILELYVYGVLDEKDTIEIASLEQSNSAIKLEIIAIEKSIINLSGSFAPKISAERYQKIKTALELGFGRVIEMQPQSNTKAYLGWAASFAILLGAGYLYVQLNESQNTIATIETQKSELQKSVVDLQFENQETSTALNIVRDSENTVVTLGGQAVAPKSFARIYWNQEKQTVFVDASGLPTPPEGKVYQIWSLKLVPTLTPTSIGLLDDFNENGQKIFAVDGTIGAEAFGITLEPDGGSTSPTMEQLYVLGKV
jgi:anti-sigma-K factor RskA